MTPFACLAIDHVRRVHDRLNGQTHEETRSFPEAELKNSRLYAHGLELFVETPMELRIAASRPTESESYHAVWRVRAQLFLKHGQSTWVFPAPKPRDPTPFSPAHAKPDFEKVDQLFWADETTHSAWSGK